MVVNDMISSKRGLLRSTKMESTDPFSPSVGPRPPWDGLAYAVLWTFGKPLLSPAAPAISKWFLNDPFE